MSVLGIAAQGAAAAGTPPGSSTSAAATRAGTGAAGPPRDLPVTAAALYAPQTGQILYSVNVNRRLPIASTTKLMTALVTMQHVHRLSNVFAQNNWYPAPEDSQLGLVPGERMSVHDLVEAMMLPSADDAAEDLAYNVGRGSVARFLAMMNAEARRLGLSHTHYTTPTGLDTPGNYSSAGDLVRLAEYDLTHSRFLARVVALRGGVVREGSRLVHIGNLNNLVREYSWIDGVKTGHTNQAGYVLVAAGHRHGMSLISAVLGTPSETARDASSLSLLDYGFGSFSLRRPVRAGEVLARPQMHDQPGTRVAVVAGRGYERLVKPGDRMRISVQVPPELTGPLPARAVVGTATVFAGGQAVARIPLVLRQRLPAVSALTIAAHFVTRPLTLGVIVVVALGGLFWRGVRRRRRMDRQGGEVRTA
ncbi:MAG TPA: D-alanyl-D-alanine carboxypeptidase family protein [Solirubrobacteraceae bacterium]|nr:D-alanyl-D-alanine carboxypeptidase family protein [Solirubrobacteraceae bacterium]